MYCTQPLRCVPLAVALLIAHAAPAALAREPLNVIPAQHLIAWNGRPLPDLPPLGEGPSSLDALLSLGMQFIGGKADAWAQWAMRSGELFSLTIRRPHAFALLDAGAERPPDRPNALRASDLKMVLAVQLAGTTPADAEPFLRVIQKAVNEQTNRASASLETRRTGDWTYQELRDQRLPPWAPLAWGRIDDLFVLTLGTDVWPVVATVAAGRAPGILDDSWQVESRKRRGESALIEIFVNAQALRARLDPLLQGRASRFFEAWDVADSDAAYWTLGLEGRALFCEARYRTAGASSHRTWADPAFNDARILATVAPDVRYAVYERPVARLVAQLANGALSLLGDDERAWMNAVWTRAAGGANAAALDLDKTFYPELGNRILLVNDPPHPLRIPIAVTSLLEIRGDAEPVRRTIDAACTAYRDALDAALPETRPAFHWLLRRDDDGVWSVQYGPIAGPAWTVTPRFIVTSWSPQALRQYLDRMAPALGLSPATTQTGPKP
jgi:hypothetical protein